MSKISKEFKEYVNALVEEIVLQAMPFGNKKKYLKKYADAEGIDFNKVEKGIEDFLSLLPTGDKIKLRLYGELIYLSPETLDKLIESKKNEFIAIDARLRRDSPFQHHKEPNDVANDLKSKESQESNTLPVFKDLRYTRYKNSIYLAWEVLRCKKVDLIINDKEIYKQHSKSTYRIEMDRDTKVFLRAMHFDGTTSLSKPLTIEYEESEKIKGEVIEENEIIKWYDDAKVIIKDEEKENEESRIKLKEFEEAQIARVKKIKEDKVNESARKKNNIMFVIIFFCLCLFLAWLSDQNNNKDNELIQYPVEAKPEPANPYGTFGLGFSYDFSGDYPSITSILNGSSLANYGIQVGDKILMINDKDISYLSDQDPDELKTLILGEFNSEIKLTIFKTEPRQIQSYILKRDFVIEDAH